MSLLKSTIVAGLTTLVMAWGVPALKAQQQINTQLNTQGSAPPQSTRSYVPQQFELLPSERRFAFERSGMLPSEFRMNEEAVGPLAPQGAVNYIEPQSLLQRELRLPPPVLYNPYYVKPLPANINAPEPPPPLPPTENFSLRPSTAPAAPSNSLSPARIDQNVWGNPATDQESTVTYYLPKKTTRPSIAPAQPQRHESAPPATRPVENVPKK